MTLGVGLTSIVLAACLTLLSGCAGALSSGTPMDGSDRFRCERDGLFWHANLGICESI